MDQAFWQKKHIVNPNVIYKINQNGHFNVFRTENAGNYMKKLDLEYENLNYKYNGNIPHEVQAEYYSQIDKRKNSELDINLMNDIDTFFIENLEK